MKRWCNENKIDKDITHLIRDEIQQLQECLTRKEFNEQLKNTKVTVKSMCVYFWEYYIKNGSRFPPELWAGFTNSSSDRTNNVLESKNRNIKERIGENLSIINFLNKSREYSNNQWVIISAERNSSSESILNAEEEYEKSDQKILEKLKKKKSKKIKKIINNNNKIIINSNKKNNIKNNKNNTKNTIIPNNNNTRSYIKGPKINCRIESLFPNLSLWFRGTVIAKNLILYDDGEEREVSSWDNFDWRISTIKGSRISGIPDK